MSLLIVGSCSKITSNIVLALAKNNLYQSITIADPLPLYHHHQRYYKLRKNLNDQQSKIPVAINKLLNIEQLNKQISNHQDVLYVTHDYFATVTAKQKIMELTAQLTKQKQNVLFAAPIEYDHYGQNNPEQTYLDAKSHVQQINPNAKHLRSDVQDQSQLYAHIHKSKKIWDEKALANIDSFRPKVVNTQFFVQKVLEQLKEGQKGSDVVVRGERERHYTEVAHDRLIDDIEMDHHIPNIRLITSKYRGPEDRYSTLLVSKFA